MEEYNTLQYYSFSDNSIIEVIELLLFFYDNNFLINFYIMLQNIYV